MFVADLVKEIACGLSETYSIPWDVYIIEMGEGDINIEVFPSQQERACVLGFRLYLGYTRFVLEFAVKNAHAFINSLFATVRKNLKNNLLQAKAIGKLLGDKGDLLYTINNHKYTSDNLNDSIDSPWLSLSIRFDSYYTNVYDKLDFHYQNFKDQVKTFAGLILLCSYSKEEQEPLLYNEGKERTFNGTRYERNSINREICLASKGYRCSVCGISMEQLYGEIGKDYIEVHHIIPVSEYGEERLIDPLEELVPVCPNCHAMLHRRKPPYSIDELKAKIKKTARGTK